METISNVMAPLGHYVESARNTLGDWGYQLGGPATGAAFATAPEAILSFIAPESRAAFINFGRSTAQASTSILRGSQSIVNDFFTYPYGSPAAQAGRIGIAQDVANKPITSLDQLTAAHFSTGPGEAVFYAGRGNLNRLAAEGSGGMTISQTQGGKALDNLIDWSSMTLEESRALATPYSKLFAERASGEVRAWAGGASRDSVFLQTELPALLSNPNVTKITIYDAFNTSHTRIIYPRR